MPFIQHHHHPLPSSARHLPPGSGHRGWNVTWLAMLSIIGHNLLSLWWCSSTWWKIYLYNHALQCLKWFMIVQEQPFSLSSSHGWLHLFPNIVLFTKEMQRWWSKPLVLSSFLASRPTLHLGPHTDTQPAFHCFAFLCMLCFTNAFYFASQCFASLRVYKVLVQLCKHLKLYNSGL